MKKKKEAVKIVEKVNNKTNKKDYINKKEFTDEIMICKQRGELTKKAVDFFILLANKSNRRLTYRNPLDREDCIQSALYDCLKYWKNFDHRISDNAFSFFTQMCKNGYTKEWNKIHKNKVETISLNYDGESEIYTI